MFDGLDLRKHAEEANVDLKKVLDTVGTGSTGAELLIPQMIDRGLRRFVEYSSPIYDILTKKDWSTNVYMFRKQTARSSAAFTAEGAIASASDPTFARPSVTMKYITSTGEVTGPMLTVARKTGRDMVDVWQEQLDDHALALTRKIERTIVAGDSVANALEFDGLKVQLSNASNNKNFASGALTLSGLDEALDLPDVYPDLLITEKAQRRRLQALLQAQQRFTERVEVRAGFKVMAYNEVPILTVDNEADADLGGFILGISRSEVLMPTLQLPMFEYLGRTADKETFFVKMYTCIAVEDITRHHTKIYGIVNP